jgi:hypothetical protein
MSTEEKMKLILKMIDNNDRIENIIMKLRFKRLNFNDFLIFLRNHEKQMEKLLKLLNINVTLFNLLVAKIKEYYSDRKYKRKYSYEYNLILTLQLKNDLNNWRALSKLNIYDSNTKYHFKVINSQFIRWTNKGIFKKAFEESKSKFINDDNKELLIDITAFNNKYGIENKVINSE